MEMILLDWTRMGRSYCLAGLVPERKGYRVVRPLPVRNRSSVVRNVGWSPFLMEGHTRWEIFELVTPEAALSEPPHTEDHWVRSLRPRRRLADMAQRRAILQATTVSANESLFGFPLQSTRAGAYLASANGTRSLVTVVVPVDQTVFAGSWRAGALEPDWRVSLPLPEIGVRQLAVKDHFLLQHAARVGNDLNQQTAALSAAVRRMGQRVAVRVGLSRAFQTQEGAPGFCWLMADGFFSLTEPMP